MAATICPTILASDTDAYREQIERVAGFATRIHIDVTDGQFAPADSVGIDQIWWPGGVRADIHVMYAQPFEHAQLLLDLRPQLIIVHAEAEGDFLAFADEAHRVGVEVGVALLPETTVDVIAPALDAIDHVLVFSGHLGYFGGTANLHMLTKVLRLKQLKPTLEVGWDGGVDDRNAATIAAGGADVLNVGGFFQRAQDPAAAYYSLDKSVRALPTRHKWV